MLIAHSRQAIGVIVLCVLGIAHTDVRLFHQLDDGGKHLFAGHAGPLQVMLDAFAKPGQCFCKMGHAFIFCLVAHLAPVRMVAGLLAAAGIASRIFYI